MIQSPQDLPIGRFLAGMTGKRIGYRRKPFAQIDRQLRTSTGLLFLFNRQVVLTLFKEG